MAVSTDSIYSHKVFMEISPSARKINYPLLSDRSHEVSEKYGAMDGNTGADNRATFIIDPYGRIQCTHFYPKAVGRNIDEIIRIIEGLQFNESTGLGAPSGWNPGKPGIKMDITNAGKY